MLWYKSEQTMGRYYIYGHFREDSNEIFYIGKGTNYRGFVRNRNNPFWNNFVKKHKWYSSILIPHLAEEDAKIFEKILIKAHGRRDLGLGPLLNLTNGGDGGPNRKGKKNPHTEEWNRKIGNSLKGGKRKPFSDSHKNKISLYRQGKKHSQETRNKIKESWIKRKSLISSS